MIRNSIYRSNAGEPSHQQKNNETNFSHPVSAIQQYLNMRRITKDKGCLIIFLIYCLGLVIMLGIGFFYGNYSDLGQFVNNGAPSADRINCNDLFLNQQMTTCSASCQTGQIKFIGRVCIDSLSYNPTFQKEVDGLISMYNIKYTFNMITYVSAGLLGVTTILFILVIYIPWIIYAFVSSLFFMLLGMAFYLLKNVQLRIQQNAIPEGSIFYTNQQNTRVISFLLLGIYLLIFPFVLFSPKKIKLCIFILSKIKQYYQGMSNMIIFSIFVICVIWGSLIIQIFLVMHFYSAGTISSAQITSMFHTYQSIYLRNEASLVFHFIGVFWVYSTIISWHKYFVSSSMCLWYFQDSQSLHPIRRGLKRSLHHIGSAAIDGILMPLQWLLLFVYAVLKTDTSDENQAAQQQAQCITGCCHSFRAFFMSIYRLINRGSPSSAVLTNQNYLQSCENSAEIFAVKSYKFFNIGGTLTIFLTLFVCILWIIIMYFIVYAEVLNKQFPPVITSVVLPVFCVFIMGLVVGSLFSNIYTASIDCLLFCYLTQKKNLSQAQLQRKADELKIKIVLDQYFHKSDEDDQAVINVYQQQNQNTMELSYVSKKQ